MYAMSHVSKSEESTQSGIAACPVDLSLSVLSKLS